MKTLYLSLFALFVLGIVALAARDAGLRYTGGRHYHRQHPH